MVQRRVQHEGGSALGGRDVIRQDFDIDGWWQVTVFYMPHMDDMVDVCAEYESIGCPDDDINEIYILMTSERNRGATYSSMWQRRSIVTIGRASAWEQLFDTILHEISHVVDDIILAYDVMNYGEPPAYLQGYIGRMMAPAVRMICYNAAALPLHT